MEEEVVDLMGVSDVEASLCKYQMFSIIVRSCNEILGVGQHNSAANPSTLRL
jgi:hypothetical protein